MNWVRDKQTAHPVALRAARGQSGVSMMELALGLAASALLGMVMWGLLAQQRIFDASASRDPSSASGAVRDALIGHLMQHAKLPCPDGNGDGREDCAAHGTSGGLPWVTLGLTRSYAVWRYGVDAALTSASNRQLPSLPPSPPTFVMPTGYSSGVINVLDGCRGLVDHLRTPSATAPLVDGVRVAYVIAHPGPDAQWSDTHAGGGWGSPTAGTAADDVVHARTSTDLSLALGCPQRLALAKVAERAAHANYDDDQIAQWFLQYRDLAYQIRQSNLTFANVSVAIASVDLANAIATSAGSVAVAVNSAGGASGAIAGAVLSVTFAGISLGAAIYSQVTATEKRDVAAEQLAAAAQWRVQAAQQRLDSYDRAIRSDMQGGRL